MKIPAAILERRKQEEADASVIAAAYRLVAAKNAERWVAPWIDQDGMDARQVDLDAALARLREVVLRQAAER
jgi:hypothetical protein